MSFHQMIPSSTCMKLCSIEKIQSRFWKYEGYFPEILSENNQAGSGIDDLTFFWQTTVDG